MKLEKYFILVGFATAFLCSSCMGRAEYEVGYSGALHQMMLGDLSATVSLDTLGQKPMLYAIGAMEDLKGEIQIFNSLPLNTSVQDGEIVLDKTFNKNGALLVYAEVEQWQTIALPKKLASSLALEAYIAKKAKEKGVNLEKPFPFLIEGRVNALKWHVIDWVEGDTIHTHEKHQKSGLNGILRNKDVEIIGFYSRFHKAVFTHQTTFVHMHFKSRDEQIAGHVDEFLTGTAMTLKLPKTNK